FVPTPTKQQRFSDGFLEGTLAGDSLVWLDRAERTGARKKGGQGRSRQGPADREPGMRGLSRRRRQFDDQHQSKARRPARRLSLQAAGRIQRETRRKVGGA